MRLMMAIREWLRLRRSSLRVALALASVLGALVWAHNGGEQHPMPGEHADDGVVAMCLAVLNIGAVFTAAAALEARRRRHGLLVIRHQDFEYHDPIARKHISFPRPRAGPRQLQVFLR